MLMTLVGCFLFWAQTDHLPQAQGKKGSPPKPLADPSPTRDLLRPLSIEHIPARQHCRERAAGFHPSFDLSCAPL